MILGAYVILYIHIVVVLIQHVRVRLLSVFQFLRALIIQFALAGVVCGSLQLPRSLPLVLRFPQLLLVLHASVLEPRFYLHRAKSNYKENPKIISPKKITQYKTNTYIYFLGYLKSTDRNKRFIKYIKFAGYLVPNWPVDYILYTNRWNTSYSLNVFYSCIKYLIQHWKHVWNNQNV